MINFKFNKPFSSFLITTEYSKLSLKERWIYALHDPGYLLLWAFAIALFTYIILR